MNQGQLKDPVSHIFLAGAVGSILVSDTRDSRFELFYRDDKYFYRSQRSWGMVIFSQASVILSTGGVPAHVGGAWSWGDGSAPGGGGASSRGEVPGLDPLGQLLCVNQP